MDQQPPTTDDDPSLVLCWTVFATDPGRFSGVQTARERTVFDSLSEGLVSSVDTDRVSTESSAQIDRLLFVRQDGRVVEPSAPARPRTAADGAEFSRALFEAAMTTIIRAAHRNGIDVRDCWALRNADGTPDWEVEINTVQKPLD